MGVLFEKRFFLYDFARGRTLIKDETRLARSVWDAAGEDTLRGLFLSKLKSRYDKSSDEGERIRLEQAARWGLAALENREEVVSHEDQ